MPQARLKTIEQALLQAKKLTKQGDIAGAVKIYTAVLQQQPSHVLAKKALRKLQKSRPGKHVSDSSGGAPASSQLQVLKHLYDSGDMEGTERACKQLLSNFPHSVIALNALGAALMGQGKYPQAVQQFDQLIQLHPESTELYYNRGIALKGMGELEQAVESYDRAIRLKPDYAGACFNRGVVLKELGRVTEAIASYDQAIAIQPDYAEAYYNRGNAQKELGLFQKAADSYSSALQIKPDFASAYSNRGNVLRELGRTDEAIASLEQALEIDPQCLSAEYLLNALKGNTTDCAPKEFIELLFDDYAQRFDQHLVSELGYDAPGIVRQAMDQLGFSETTFKKAIDLGCGTGLSGMAFMDIVETMVGVDLSAKMVAQARDRNMYQALYVDDVVGRLEGMEERFDFFISTDVLVYIGNLLPLFQAVVAHAVDGSIFVFSTEHSKEAPFLLQKTGRYAHSKAYILSLGESLGLQLEYFAEFNLRKHEGRWITGGAYIMRYRA